MRSLMHIFATLTMVVMLHVSPKRPNDDAITTYAKRPRLEQTEQIIRPLIPPDALGMALLFRKDSFTKVFDLIRGRPYEEGESMMPSNFDLFPALRYHDAAQDDNFALRNWFDLDSSKKKLEQLKILLLNPTVDFSIEHSFVLEHASEFGDLEVIKKIVESGASPTAEAVIQASIYGQEKIVNYYLDYEYWNRSRLVFLAAGHGDLGLFKSLIEKPEFKEDLENQIIDVFQNACSSGNLDLVKFLTPFLPDFEDDDHSTISDISEGTILSGNIDLVNYIQENGLISLSNVIFHMSKLGKKSFVEQMLERINISPDTSMGLAAIEGGNFEVLKLIENRGGIRYDNTLQDEFSDAFNSACKEGSLKFIKYVIKNYHVDPNSGSLENAINGGNLEVALHFIEHHNISSSERLDRLVRRHGWGWNADRTYYDFLNYLAKKFNYKYDFSELKLALEQKNVFYARYLLLEQKIVPNQEIVKFAVRDSRISLLRLLIQKYELLADMKALEAAAEMGNIDDILFLTRRGVIPDQEVWRLAILSSQSDYIVKYFIKELKLDPILSSLDLACIAGKLRLVKFFIQSNGLKPNKETMRVAALRNYLYEDNDDVIDYLIHVNSTLRAVQVAYDAEFTQRPSTELHAIYDDFLKV